MKCNKNEHGNKDISTVCVLYNQQAEGRVRKRERKEGSIRIDIAIKRKIEATNQIYKVNAMNELYSKNINNNLASLTSSSLSIKCSCLFLLLLCKQNEHKFVRHTLRRAMFMSIYIHIVLECVHRSIK